VPVWHDTTKDLTGDEFQVLGIVQEQHPDRSRLFMQWKQMDWPILVDSLNLLGVSAVPISLFIDEHGVVRGKASREELSRFLGAAYVRPRGLPEEDASWPSPDELRDSARAKKGEAAATAWLDCGDAYFLRADPSDLGRALEAYRQAEQLGAGPEAVFRQGVVLRRRHESSERQTGDLQAGFDAWGAALSRRPNQYIWRRRIQQYGPRLEKPYAFYDWVEEARRDVAARGEVPVNLAVEPGGAELAQPGNPFADESEDPAEPDPQGRIVRDTEGLVVAEVGVVPARIQAGKSVRVHVALRPRRLPPAHWNNEADDLVLWVEGVPGLAVDRSHGSVPNPGTRTSREERRLEFEVQAAESLRAGTYSLPAYTLVYVCRDDDGTCLYLRKDIPIEVRCTE
jgi:hypothetical protein